MGVLENPGIFRKQENENPVLHFNHGSRYIYCVCEQFVTVTVENAETVISIFLYTFGGTEGFEKCCLYTLKNTAISYFSPVTTFRVSRAGRVRIRVGLTVK